MCGIAGLYAPDGSRPADAAAVRAMTDRLVHRGPDHGGVHADGPVGLGSRRLAIIDLPGGNQPLASPDGELWVVYNGELYKADELRADLAARGFHCRTRSDTELILLAYAAEGPGCCRLLNGMFAFAVWDARRRELFLARDRLGIKPLFYTWQPPWFGFASEVKALLLPPLRPAAADPNAAADTLLYGYPHGDETLFRDVRSLPAGHTLRVAADGTRLTDYWDVPVEPEAEGVDHLGRTAELLADSVGRHLVSDVPLGCCLSGGLDSSVVTALAARHRPGLPTYSIGYAANSELFRRWPSRIV